MEMMNRRDVWRPPVIATSSFKTTGFEELVAALERHRESLRDSDAGRARLRRIAEFRMLKTAEELLRLRFRANSAGRAAALADRLAARLITPYAAGEQLLDGLRKEA